MAMQRSAPYRRQMEEMETAELWMLEEVSDILELALAFLVQSTDPDIDVLAELLSWLKKFKAKQKGEDVSLEHPDSPSKGAKKKSVIGPLSPEEISMKLRPMFIHLSRSVVASEPDSVIDHLVDEVSRAIEDHEFKREVWVEHMRKPAHLS